MITLRLRFPGRRYHATPWGNHVNEGQIEWPPTPWRLLRALLSTGYTKLGWEQPPEEARALVEKLANALPVYGLPEAGGAHSRHYMPIGVLKNGREQTTLVFDTWAQVEDGELTVAWPVELEGPERTLLAALVERLGYLGRSESWVEGRLEDLAGPARKDSYPCEGAPHPGPGWEQVAVLAPETPEAARRFLEAHAPPVATEPAKGKKPAKAKSKKKAEPGLPSDLLGCLQLETSYLQSQGWSQPPGSRRVLYWRRTDALEAAGPARKPSQHQAPAVEAMLLAMATTTGNLHALPPVTRTLPQGELLHRALVSRGAQSEAAGLEVLTGLDGQGAPLTGHRHVHLLHLDLDDDGHLDHVLLWAAGGIAGPIQEVVRKVRATYSKGVAGSLPLALAGYGTLAELGRLPPPWGEALRHVVGTARTWRSRTPFVPPRFLKPRGKNNLIGQVMAELESRKLPAAAVEVIDLRDDTALRLRHYVRARRHGPPPPMDCGFQLRLTFQGPVAGPLCLGYGAHFGLGRFDTEG